MTVRLKRHNKEFFKCTTCIRKKEVVLLPI